PTTTLPSFPTRRSSDLKPLSAHDLNFHLTPLLYFFIVTPGISGMPAPEPPGWDIGAAPARFSSSTPENHRPQFARQKHRSRHARSEEHTSELQSRSDLV